MPYKEIHTKSLLKKITHQDTLFLGKYTIDPYQNCAFGCSYCDSSIDETIYIKTNAAEILRKEIEDIPKGMILVGSVFDPYQEAEKEYRITKELLEIIAEYEFPCHILTKSTLILRDLNILSKMKSTTVTQSIISLDEYISKILEKNVSYPLERLEIIKKLHEHDIKAGLAIMPAIPFLIDKEIELIVKTAVEHKAQYIVYKYLELKGDQSRIFTDIIKKYFPKIHNQLLDLYISDFRPDKKFRDQLDNMMNQLYSKYKMKGTINQRG